MEERTQIRELESGLVQEVLPKGMFLIRLESGVMVRGGVDIGCRGVIVRLIAGDRVEVRPTQRDPTRVQIVRKR